MIGLICVSILVVIGLALLRPAATSNRAAKQPVPLDTHECRCATHEAGHALAAWMCTAVSSVEHITINDNGGRVRYAFRCDESADIYWCGAVIGLAGVAAEIVNFGKVRAKPAEDDLLTVRRLAREIVADRSFEPPWKSVEPRTLPFADMYHVPLSEEEELVLAKAYAMAREILIAYERPYYQLVGAILAKRQLSTSDITEIFGGRFRLELIGMFRPTFVLPRSK